MEATMHAMIQSLEHSIDSTSNVPTLDQINQAYTAWVLELCNNNKSKAADLLGINRRTLHRKMQRKLSN